MKLERGQWYLDKEFNAAICFEGEGNGLFWFYYPEEERCVVYYANELDKLERY